MIHTFKVLTIKENYIVLKCRYIFSIYFTFLKSLLTFSMSKKEMTKKTLTAVLDGFIRKIQKMSFSKKFKYLMSENCIIDTMNKYEGDDSEILLNELLKIQENFLNMFENVDIF